MMFMVVHTKLNERVQCLLQGWFSRLVVVAHKVRHNVMNKSLIIVSLGEVWMTPPPRVVIV